MLSFLPPWCLLGASQAVQMIISCLPGASLAPRRLFKWSFPASLVPPWCLPGCPNGHFLPPWFPPGASQAVQLVLFCLPGASLVPLSCLPGASLAPRGRSNWSESRFWAGAGFCLNFSTTSMANGPVRGKSWGGPHGRLPVAQAGP